MLLGGVAACGAIISGAVPGVVASLMWVFGCLIVKIGAKCVAQRGFLNI